jgi:hypothetical protein
VVVPAARSIAGDASVAVVEASEVSSVEVSASSVGDPLAHPVRRSKADNSRRSSERPCDIGRVCRSSGDRWGQAGLVAT